MAAASIGRPSLVKPIHPRTFADKMAATIKSLNPQFYCSGKIWDGFMQYCLAYNDCVDLNRIGNSSQIIIPAATGSGKTVSATLYLSEIAQMGFSGLFIVSEVSVAIEAAELINNLIGEKIAGVYYSISNKNPQHELWCNINKLPIITIITHAMFIQRSDTLKDIKALRSFRGRQRDVIIIDERIDLIKRVSFGTTEINDAVAILNRDVGLQGIAEILVNFNDVIFNSQFSGTYPYSGSFEQSHRALRSDLLFFLNKLNTGSYNIVPQLRGILKNSDPDREKLKDLLDRIAYVIDGRFSHTIEGHNVIIHREENLSGNFGSVVVLDAMSLINPEYGYRDINNHDIILLDRIISRNYSNVTLNLCSLKGPGQSKSALYTEPLRQGTLEKIILGHLKIIGSILEPNDKLLVVTYMDMVPYFELNNPYGDQVEFIHWGSKKARGSNAFIDFNKAMTIGWFRKPTHYYVASVMAINQFDRYVSSTGSVWSDANHLQDMLIVDDMIQFFNRVRCRTAIDNNGNCLPVELYCFTAGKIKMEEVIRTSIESEMTDILIKDWIPNELRVLQPKLSTDEKRAEFFIMLLRGMIGKHEEVSLNELRNRLTKLTPHQISRAIRTDLFDALLKEEGIIMTEDKTMRGSPKRFILPKQ